MGVLMRPLIFLSQIKVRSIFSEFFMKETIVAQATAPGRGGIGICVYQVQKRLKWHKRY